jgi:hypothetical protein
MEPSKFGNGNQTIDPSIPNGFVTQPKEEHSEKKGGSGRQDMWPFVLLALKGYLRLYQAKIPRTTCATE